MLCRLWSRHAAKPLFTQVNDGDIEDMRRLTNANLAGCTDDVGDPHGNQVDWYVSAVA
jgi:hypothetical protein